MSTQPTHPATALPPTASTTPEMPASPFSARSKRKTHDENAASSRIPVKSPTSALTVATFNAPRSSSSSKKPSVKPSVVDKSSIPFPKNAIPAPAVVTPLLVDALGRVNAKPHESPRIGKGPRQSTTSKSKPKQVKQKPSRPVPPTLWKTLVSSGKGIIAETMDRDRE